MDVFLDPQIPWYEWPLDSLEAKEAYLFNRLNPLLDKR